MANDILVFADDAGANVLTQVEYAADTQRTIGNQPGIARSSFVNKVLRQTSFIAASLAQLIVDRTGQSVLDDGNDATLLTNMKNATDVAYNINAATSKPVPIDSDLIGLVDSAASNVLKKVTISELRTSLSTSILQDFRLTLTTGVPVTISGVTAAISIYLTPYVGNKLSIYDGSAWITYATAELSIAVPATTNTMYDIFVYSNAGTPTLELTAWTNDTTRATALDRQDGVYVKSGSTTRRYLGSFRTTGVSGQTEDSTSKRYLWNYYNRVTRAMYITDATVSWAYSTGTWRQANGNTANQIDFVIGVNEDIVRAYATHAVANSSTAGLMQTGIGLDITNSPSNLVESNGSTAGTAMLGTPTAEFVASIPAGRHFLAWLEKPTAVGTSTWTTNQIKVGLQGEIIG